MSEQQLRERRVKLWVEVDGTNRLVETSLQAIADAVPAVGRLLEPIPDKVLKDELGDVSGAHAVDLYRAWLIGGND